MLKIQITITADGAPGRLDDEEVVIEAPAAQAPPERRGPPPMQARWPWPADTAPAPPASSFEAGHPIPRPPDEQPLDPAAQRAVTSTVIANALERGERVLRDLVTAWAVNFDAPESEQPDRVMLIPLYIRANDDWRALMHFCNVRGGLVNAVKAVGGTKKIALHMVEVGTASGTPFDVLAPMDTLGRDEETG